MTIPAWAGHPYARAAVARQNPVASCYATTVVSIIETTEPLAGDDRSAESGRIGWLTTSRGLLLKGVVRTVVVVVRHKVRQQPAQMPLVEDTA